MNYCVPLFNLQYLDIVTKLFFMQNDFVSCNNVLNNNNIILAPAAWGIVGVQQTLGLANVCPCASRKRGLTKGYKLPYTPG